MPAASFRQIFKREFKAYFLTPIGYIVIVIFLLVSGWFFFSSFFLAGRADLRGFFALLPVILSFAVPAITMRLFSEEFRSGSYEILLTLPVTAFNILMGKFLASLAFVVIMILPTLSYPLFITFLGELDWGPVAGGYIGAAFLAASYCAIGLFASSLTRNQIVAFIIAAAVCFLLTILDGMLFFIPRGLVRVLQFVSSSYHFQNISKGILDSRDLIYFVSVCFLALFGTHAVIEARKEGAPA
jgi:ABC-2 type transport system permease protein